MNVPLFEFLKNLPAGHLTKADIICDATLLARDGRLAVHYVPFEYFPPTARVVLVGITPGFTQMRLAYEAARDFQAQATDELDIHRVAKLAAAFGGPMRRILCGMLDELGLPQSLSLNSADAMFEEEFDAVTFTSVLRYPVFVDGGNYTGHTPKLPKSDFLVSFVRDHFAKTVEKFPEALIVPMGRAVEDVIRLLGLPNPILWGFPHPSPANAHRRRQFEDNKLAMKHVIYDWKN